MPKTDTFKLWCWGRLLRVPWTARRSNQSTLKEIKPEYSLEGLVLKLKFQHFGHLMQTANSLEKSLMLEKMEGRRRGCQSMRWLDGITMQLIWTWANSRKWWGTGRPGVLQPMGSDMTGWLSNNNPYDQCSYKRRLEYRHTTEGKTCENRGEGTCPSTSQKEKSKKK